eukprot:764277-Hanusia_phi.AAC.1
MSLLLLLINLLRLPFSSHASLQDSALLYIEKPHPLTPAPVHPPFLPISPHLLIGGCLLPHCDTSSTPHPTPWDEVFYSLVKVGDHHYPFDTNLNYLNRTHHSDEMPGNQMTVIRGHSQSRHTAILAVARHRRGPARVTAAGPGPGPGPGVHCRVRGRPGRPLYFSDNKGLDRAARRAGGPHLSLGPGGLKPSITRSQGPGVSQ